MCYSHDTPITLVNQVISQLESSKYVRLILHSDDDPNIELQKPHIQHTLATATALIIILPESQSISIKSLTWCIDIAKSRKMRAYFVGTPNPSIDSILSSLEIPPYLISSLQWTTDGLTVALEQDSGYISVIIKKSLSLLIEFFRLERQSKYQMLCLTVL